jgi:hypothetical protein
VASQDAAHVVEYVLLAIGYRHRVTAQSKCRRWDRAGGR